MKLVSYTAYNGYYEGPMPPRIDLRPPLQRVHADPPIPIDTLVPGAKDGLHLVGFCFCTVGGDMVVEGRVWDPRIPNAPRMRLIQSYILHIQGMAYHKFRFRVFWQFMDIEFQSDFNQNVLLYSWLEVP
jgi:hypothetical protein